MTIILSSKLYEYLDFTPFLQNISDFCLRQYSTLRQKKNATVTLRAKNVDSVRLTTKFLQVRTLKSSPKSS